MLKKIKIRLLLVLLLVSVVKIYCVNPNPAAFGEFVLLVKSFDPCQGPKRKDCAVVNSKIVGPSTILYDMVVTQNMKPTRGKIVAISNNKPLARLQAEHPCTHLFLRPLFQSMLNVTEDCTILKGHYRFALDWEKVAKSYYQGSFLYGDITFKSSFYNNVCNLSCTVVKVTMAPKESPK